MKIPNPLEDARASASPFETASTAPAPLDRYLWALLGMLMSVTIFEGYDVTIFHLCTPDIARTFHLDDRAVGGMASLVRLGGMLAFFVVIMADRVGRKPIVSLTVVFYALFTLLTALSRGLGTFTLFQSSAQLFLSAEFTVAIIMISEEFPDRMRGTGVAMLNLVGLLGVVAAGTLYGPVAESRWGWRGMYFIGVGPLMLVAFIRRGMRETARFEQLRPSRALAASAGRFKQVARAAFVPFTGRHRGRLLLVALLWNCVGLVSAPSVTFFSLYAKRDHHWTSAQVGSAIVIAYTVGTLGHLLCGRMLDVVGRKATSAAFYLFGAVSMLVLFQAASHGVMLAALVAAVFGFQGARTATATYSAELFPTEIRATSYSLTVQVLGQITALASPFLIGALSKSLGGLGNAVAAVCVGPVIGAILVALYAPETMGKRLEELG
ncbi:MAG: MFS transporter [Candidatus Binataceae bacterium]